MQKLTIMVLPGNRTLNPVSVFPRRIRHPRRIVTFRSFVPLVTGGFRAYRSAQHRPSGRVVATFPFLARGSLRKFSLGQAGVSFRRIETSFCEVRDEENRLQEEERWSCNPLDRESRDTPWNLRGGIVRLLLIRLDYLRATAPALTLSLPRLLYHQNVASSRDSP